MNRIRNLRRAAALTVVTAAVVVGAGVASPAHAVPPGPHSSAMCNYLWNMSNTYFDLALNYPTWSFNYAYYMSLARPYNEAFNNACH